jgi:4'-phosphopantetheinyl transferase
LPFRSCVEKCDPRDFVRHPLIESLESDEAHLWCAAWDIQRRDPAREARYAELLTDEERKQWRAYRFEEGQLEYLMTRALVRDVLSRYVPEIAPRAWRFVRSDHGRPSVAAELGVQVPRFNLSNTKGLVICGVSSDEIGVDVEPAGRGVSVLPIKEDVFSPAELASLGALPETERAERAIKLWTLKEAYIKARSMGLSLPLKRFSMTFGDVIGIDIHPSIAVAGENWQFYLCQPTGEHVVALALERGVTGRNRSIILRNIVPLDDLASTYQSGLT